jgi:hypothetical protein
MAQGTLNLLPFRPAGLQNTRRVFFYVTFYVTQ